MFTGYYDMGRTKVPIIPVVALVTCLATGLLYVTERHHSDTSRQAEQSVAELPLPPDTSAGVSALSLDITLKKVDVLIAQASTNVKDFVENLTRNEALSEKCRWKVLVACDEALDLLNALYEECRSKPEVVRRRRRILELKELIRIGW